MNKQFALVLLGLVAAVGCGHVIKYDVPLREATKNGSRLAIGEVRVSAKLPKYNAEGVVLLGAMWATNFRNGYRHGDLAEEIGDQLARHFAASGAFTSVERIPTNDAPDLVLELEVTRLRGFVAKTVEADNTEAAMVFFGFIGGVAAEIAYEDTQVGVLADAWLENVKLRDREGNIVWSGSAKSDIRRRISFGDRFDVTPYVMADEALKVAVNDLAGQLSAALPVR